MSDNPTLYVELYCYYEYEGMRFGCTTREASRADLLAALPDKEWWCAEYEGGWAPKACASPDEAKDWEHGACHWAVKP